MAKRLLVIGGGAAGLAAAVEGAGCGAHVTLLERADRVGKKILQTGNGRCNLSNLSVSPDAYNAPDFVAPVLEALPSMSIRGFFEDLGLLTYADSEGRVYPISDAAASVLDVLRLAVRDGGVQTLCGAEAVSLSPDGTVKTADGGTHHGDAVIVASGGGTALLESAGHTIVPFSPILCPLKTDTALIRGLSGQRVRCGVTLKRRGETVVSLRGEVLFRDYGVSGIVIFDLSRYAKKGDQILLDLFPDMEYKELCKLLFQRQRLFPGRAEEEFLTGLFQSRIAAALLRAAGGAEPKALATLIKGLPLQVQGCGDPKQAQVTRGGAALAEFDPVTLRSRLAPRLFAAGEALDIDGRCGGFNLHWAFASGITAARAAMEDLL
ncbi:MAG: aminoacetone oxidase family FAD-binding enzyme [Ruminococcaceae bacterium]|nr:aminoacetone oxidase family FAD-binding enzyme [Oscillospiraceae bacterium]